MSVQQAFSEHPFCAPSPDAMGRWPMELQSLPRHYAQIQKRAQSTCLLVPRGSLHAVYSLAQGRQ